MQVKAYEIQEYNPRFQFQNGAKGNIYSAHTDALITQLIEQIMEEKQSNYALGAGSISKFVYVDEDRIERVENVKNVEQYIDRVDEMIQRKVKEVYKDVN